MKNTLAVLGVLTAFNVLARAQTPGNSPAFEVATIKASGPASGPMSIQRLPGRLLTSNTPLTMLISWAYQLEEGRLFGATQGLDNLRFDVVAKEPEGDAFPGRLQLMMRTLLAERFKLVVHRETRELDAYTLVTDTGGPRVRISNNDEPAGPNPFRMSDAGMLQGTQVTTDMLANVLSNQLGRSVQNMTKLTGKFDFTLRWAPDTVAAVDFQDRPTLFTAIREQLGFRLVAQKRSVEVVVIDRVEKTPTEN